MVTSYGVKGPDCNPRVDRWTISTTLVRLDRKRGIRSTGGPLACSILTLRDVA
jgi:hypothetical protein